MNADTFKQLIDEYVFNTVVLHMKREIPQWEHPVALSYLRVSKMIQEFSMEHMGLGNKPVIQDRIKSQQGARKYHRFKSLKDVVKADIMKALIDHGYQDVEGEDQDSGWFEPVTYPIEAITQCLDAVVEPFLPKDEHGNFRNETGYMRRVFWPQSHGIGEHAKTMEWNILAEIAPEYKSSTGLSFQYRTADCHFSNATGKKDFPKGFVVHVKEAGPEFYSAMQEYKAEVLKLHEECKRP
jgi:hypothetical protein